METLAKYFNASEPIQCADFVCWGMRETTHDHLTGITFMGGIVAGAIAGALSASDPRKWSCELGVLGVGSRHIFLSPLGKIEMDAHELPDDIAQKIPSTIRPAQTIAIRPLGAEVEGPELSVRIMGAPFANHSAFRDRGNQLCVRLRGDSITQSSSGSQLIDAIQRLIAYPTSEEVLDMLLVSSDRKLESGAVAALGDLTYLNSFSGLYSRVPDEVRRAIILTARIGPDSLKKAVSYCIGRARAKARMRWLPSLLLVSAGLICAGMTCFAFVQEPDFSLGFSAMSMLSVGLLSVGAWAASSAKRALNKCDKQVTLLVRGGDYEENLAIDLALTVSGMSKIGTPHWDEIGSALQTSPQFREDLRAALLKKPISAIGEFVSSAPANLRSGLVQTFLPTPRKTAATVIAISYLVWVPLLIVGVWALRLGFVGEASTKTLLLFFGGTFLGVGGLPVACVIGIGLLWEKVSQLQLRHELAKWTVA